jgi:hypothetical protein
MASKVQHVRVTRLKACDLPDGCNLHACPNKVRGLFMFLLAFVQFLSSDPSFFT